MFEPVPLPSLNIDPFAPVLLASPPLVITAEQENSVRIVLLLSSSDTLFAKKAADALRLILLGGVNGGVVPQIGSLEPNTKAAGSPSFKMKCKGTGFDSTCKIYINGNPVTTTFTSATEVSTDVDLTSVSSATTWPVVVINGSGAVSNSMTFTVTAVVATSTTYNPA